MKILKESFINLSLDSLREMLPTLDISIPVFSQNAIAMATPVIIVPLFGPIGLSLSLPVTSLVAGAEAGEREIRHRTVYLVGGAALLAGLVAGLAPGLQNWIPVSLLRFFH